jgi:hypothetical protein
MRRKIHFELVEAACPKFQDLFYDTQSYKSFAIIYP